jgi:hypothetical protein
MAGRRADRIHLQVQLKIKTAEKLRQSRYGGLPARALNGVHHRAGYAGTTSELAL